MIVEIIISGLCYGILAGMLGIGGGVILMPLLLLILSGQTANIDTLHIVINSSIAIMTLSSFINVIQHFRLKTIDVSIISKIIPGSIMGVMVGSVLSLWVSPAHIKFILVAVLMVLTLTMLMPSHILRFKSAPRHFNLAVIGFVTGAPASLLGIGGGSIIAPLLNCYGFNIKKIVGAASFNTFVTATLALISLIVINLIRSHNFLAVESIIDWKAVLIVVPLSLVGLRIGGVLVHKISEHGLRYLFAAVLLVSSIVTLVKMS